MDRETSLRPKFLVFLGVSVLLLCILAYAAGWTTVHKTPHPDGIWVYLPRTCNGGDSFSNQIIVLNVLANGDTEINSTRFARSILGSKMAEIYANQTEKLLRLVADRNASYGDVMNAVDEVKARTPHLSVLLLSDASPEVVLRSCLWSKDVRADDL